MIITAGKFKSQKITAPDENITRPTLSKVRMGVFNTLQSMINFEECSFLDMYAGSGIMGLEALSRGFSKVVSIEKNPKAANIIKMNINKLCINTTKDENYKLLVGDSLKLVGKFNKFDVIYIDPPYFSGIYEKSLDAIENIVNNIVILEHITQIDTKNFEIIKQKKYGDKYITFLNKRRS